MNIILYILIFVIGVIFGNFCATAVYRIPQKMNIFKLHSYCPECRHKLSWWESAPIISYIFLGGKCQNCKKKIRTRYFIYEVLSGIVFVALALALDLSTESFTLNLVIELIFLILYLGAIFIIAGIDAENRKIEKSVMYYALAILILYIIYLCIIDMSSIYRYLLYVTVIIILLIVDTLILKNKAKNNYTLSILILAFIMAVFSGEVATIWSIIYTLLIIAIMLILKRVKIRKKNIKKKEENISKNLPIGFYLCITNVICLIAVILLNNI